MTKPFKPSAYQAQLLVDIAKGGRTLPPDGFPTAGRHASHWWTATEILCKQGRLRRSGNLATVRILESLPDAGFEEQVRGKTAAYDRAEIIRGYGREVVTVHAAGPNYIVRVSPRTTEDT